MAIPTFNAVGYCAHYSKQGDWAFSFALQLSQKHNVQLNVFHFLQDPYDPNYAKPKHLSHSGFEKMAIAEEKELRLYYDKLAGEYLNIGFRECCEDSWTELHRCLMISEFQILILGYTQMGANFIRKPIEEFANDFISPVILVGPENPEQICLNHQAALLSFKLGISKDKFNICSIKHKE
ncbi:MAG: universal stress protein [Ignavibacteria bacterium]|nr:universal stress protein [Ignavibacteria bacterium]MBT8382319.1 universal stress protein [Ignavibacteria bacterium]MBT8391947.1 universal stress protein [Ignavibacteria bacterium]NNJ52190.1 universal stress protein [Ignavibacteriaceae bacterium]NNL21767.1 universal stress protein [Ignavibacteriaceae bacterium]